MKDKKFTDLICKDFCEFYKEGKDELHCMTYVYLKKMFSQDLLNKLIDNKSIPDFSLDNEINEEICKMCEFLEDGCDFREGLSSPPCGGYTIIEEFLKQGVIKF